MPREQRLIPDLSAREIAVFACLVVTIVWIGMYPQPILKTASASLIKPLQRSAGVLR